MVKLPPKWPSQPELGQNIRELRLALRWSQTRLAEEAGTTQAHIAKIEAGDYNPKGDTIQKLYEAMGIRFVTDDIEFEIKTRLEQIGTSTLEGVNLILKKMKIRRDSEEQQENPE